MGLYGTFDKVRCGCSMAATRVPVPLGSVGMVSIDNLRRARMAWRRGMRVAGLGAGFLLRGCLYEKAGMSGLLPYGTPSISRVVPTFLHSCPFPLRGMRVRQQHCFLLGGGSSSLNRRGNPVRAAFFVAPSSSPSAVRLFSGFHQLHSSVHADFPCQARTVNVDDVAELSSQDIA